MHMLFLFFAAFLIIGAGLLLNSVITIYRGIISMNWPRVACQIVDAHLYDDGDNSYCPIIKYSYLFNGTQYINNVVSFCEDNHYGTRRWAEEILDRYRVGQTLGVSVNPSHPSMSVLEPGVKFDLLTMLILSIGFLVIGVMGLETTIK